MNLCRKAGNGISMTNGRTALPLPVLQAARATGPHPPGGQKPELVSLGKAAGPV